VRKLFGKELFDFTYPGAENETTGDDDNGDWG